MREAMRHRAIAGLSLFLTTALVTPRPAGAVTSDSPEVQRVVAKALRYLETADDKRLGAECLTAMVLFKTGAPLDHPKIVQAAAHAQQWARDGLPFPNGEELYSLGLAIVFLSELNPRQYAADIDRLLALLAERQQDFGAWGYLGSESGDTSMTQYCVLGMWEAKQGGLKIPEASIAKAANWLLRTQDPSGAWGYQGRDAGSFQLVAQEGKRASMGAGGLGSVLLAAHMLGLATAEPAQHTGDVPRALVPYLDPERAQPTQVNATQLVDRRVLREAIARGKKWTIDNIAFSLDQPYVYYYMYSLERCMSVLESIEGQSPREPAWYSDGVGFLATTQKGDGSWQQSFGPEVETPLAVLFLIRSMKRRLQKQQGYGAGLLAGGRGLQDRLSGAPAEAAPQPGAEDDDPIARLLAAVDAGDERGSADAALDQLVQATLRLESAPKEPPSSQQFEELRQIVHYGSPDARLVAVRLLGRSGELDQVPTLIFALTDPDVRVAIAARDGLRRISRKFDGFGLADDADMDSRRQAAEAWDAWYHSIRPHTQ